MKKIAYQGIPGSYSHSVCTQLFEREQLTDFPTFEQVFQAVESGQADHGVVPIDNAINGRVIDVNRLIPNYDVHVNAEFFLPINHQLIASPGSLLSEIKKVTSHPQALGQCRDFISKHGFDRISAANTALAAQDLASNPSKDLAVIASEEAARIYELDIIARDIEDNPLNKTRFFVISKALPDYQSYADPLSIITFTTQSIPAALFKALGGFATNFLNLVKLESFISHSDFTQSSFIIEVEASPADERLQRALKELDYFSTEVRLIGVVERKNGNTE